MPLSIFEDPEGKDDEQKKNPLRSDGDDILKDDILVESLRGADGNPMVTVDISSAFAFVIDEPRDLFINRGEALKKLLWMWWDDSQYAASDKSISDCFAKTPALYYYALAHFSDPELGFSDEEREDIKRQCCCHAGCLSEFANGVDKKALEFYWYFLVRLLTIEDRVRSAPGGRLNDEHLSMLREQYAWFLDRLHNAKRNGYITIPSISGWLDERLLDLGRQYPHLVPLITPLLKKDAVAEAMDTVDTILDQIWVRYSTLFFQEQEKTGGWEEDAILQKNIQQTLSSLRLAIAPNVGNKAWKHPMEYIIEDDSPGKGIICIDQAYTLKPKGNKNIEDEDALQRVDQVGLELLSRMTSHDTAWVFADAQVRVCPLYDVLEEQGKSGQIAEIINLVENYVNGKEKHKFSLREVLNIGEDGDSTHTDELLDCLRYWEAVRRRRQKNPIFLLNGLLAVETEKILRIFPAFDRTIILAQGNTAQILLQNKVSRGDMLVIHHQLAWKTYPEDHVCIPGCLGYTVHEFANRDGWGDFESLAVSLTKNHQLIKAIMDEDMGDQRGEFVQTYAIPLERKKYEAKWTCKDIILFTKVDDDDEHSGSTHSPIYIDSYAPVGS